MIREAIDWLDARSRVDRSPQEVEETPLVLLKQIRGKLDFYLPLILVACMVTCVRAGS